MTIVSRDCEFPLVISVDRHIVQDVPATYLNLILWSSSYVKFNICMLGRYVSLLLEGGGPREKTA
jgi:hypothetical protein